MEGHKKFYQYRGERFVIYEPENGGMTVELNGDKMVVWAREDGEGFMAGVFHHACSVKDAVDSACDMLLGPSSVEKLGREMEFFWGTI